MFSPSSIGAYVWRRLSGGNEEEGTTADNGNGESDEDEFGTDIDNPDKSMSRGQRSLDTLQEQPDVPSHKDLSKPEDENANEQREQLFVDASTPGGSESEGSCDEYADVSETLPHASDGESAGESCSVKNESRGEERIYQDLAREIVNCAIDSAVVDYTTKMSDPREERSPSPKRLGEVDQDRHDPSPMSEGDTDIKQDNIKPSAEQNDERNGVPFGDSIKDDEDGMQTPDSSQENVDTNDTDMTHEQIVSEISTPEESSVPSAGESELFGSDGTSVTTLSTSYGIVQSEDVPNAPMVNNAVDDDIADVDEESDGATTSSEADTVKDAGKDIAAREALLEKPDSTESPDDVDVGENESFRSQYSEDDGKDETSNTERQQTDFADSDVSDITDGMQVNKPAIPEIKIDTVEDRVESDDEEELVAPTDKQSYEPSEINAPDPSSSGLADTSENAEYPADSQRADPDIIVPSKASTMNPRDLSEVLTSLIGEDIPVVSGEENHSSVDAKDGLLECMTALEDLNVASVDEESAVRDQNDQISEDVITVTVAKADESSRIPLSSLFAPENENTDVDVNISTTDQDAEDDFAAENFDSKEERRETIASEDEVDILVTSKDDPHKTENSSNILNNDAADESFTPAFCQEEESGYEAVSPAHDDESDMAISQGDTSRLQDDLSNTEKDDHVICLAGGAEATIPNDQPLLDHHAEEDVLELNGEEKQTVKACYDEYVDDSSEVKASDFANINENAEYPTDSQTADPEIIVPLKASTMNTRDLSEVLTFLTGEDIPVVSGEENHSSVDAKDGLLECMTALDDLNVASVDEENDVSRDKNDQIIEDVIAPMAVKADESSRISFSCLLAPENKTLFDADDVCAAETLDTVEEYQRKFASEDEVDAPVASTEDSKKTPAFDDTDHGEESIDVNITSPNAPEAPPDDKSRNYLEDDIVRIDAGKGINRQISVRELLQSLDGETPLEGGISDVDDNKPYPGKRVITDEMVREAIAFLMTKPFYYSYGMYDSRDNIFYTYVDYDDDSAFKGERTFALVRTPSDHTKEVKSAVSALLPPSRLKNYNSLDINHVDEVVQKEHKNPKDATTNLHDLFAVLDDKATNASDPSQPVTEVHFDVSSAAVEEAVPEIMEPDHITHSDDDSSTASSSQTSGTYILDNGIIEEEEDISQTEEVPNAERQNEFSKTSSDDYEPRLTTRRYRSPSPDEYETRQREPEREPDREPDREQPKAGRVFFITSAMLAQLSEQQSEPEQENGFHRPQSRSASSESGSSDSDREYPPGYRPMSDPTFPQEPRMVETTRQQEEASRGGYPQNTLSADYDSEEGPMRFRPIPNHDSLVESRERSPFSPPQGNQQIVNLPPNDQAVSDYDSTPELLEIENRKHKEMPPSSYYNEPNQKTSNGLGDYDGNDKHLQGNFRPVMKPTANQSADVANKPTASPVRQATESRPHAVFSIRGRIDDAAHSEAELVPGTNGAYNAEDIHDIHGDYIVPENESEAFASPSDIISQEPHHQSEDNTLSHSDYLGSASSSDNEYEVGEGNESFTSGERVFAVVGTPGDTTAMTVIGAIEVYRSEEDMETQKSLFSYEISRGRAGPDGKIKRLLEQSITFEHRSDEPGVTEADGQVQEEPTRAGYSTEDSFAAADLQLELPCDSMGEELSDREGLQRQVNALDNLLSEKTLELQSFKDHYPWLDRLLANPKETLPGYSEGEIVGLMQVYKQLEEEVLEYMNIYKETKTQLTELIAMQRS
ncbi:uncharacterized protein [Diadema antillarum]|uniref:uncharacterized protein n=1 Tax=Diadema antillarum TaxID=105358 RepID=UPI003A8781B0